MDNDDLLSVLLLFGAVMVYNSARNRHRLTRSAIQPPKLSPWAFLLNHGDDGSFLELTGFTRPAFMQIEVVLFSDGNAGIKRGRPSLLDDRGQLGL